MKGNFVSLSPLMNNVMLLWIKKKLGDIRKGWWVESIMYTLHIHIIRTVAYPEFGSSGGQNIFDTRGVHKVSFPLVPQLLNHLLREATACTW